MPVPLTRQLPVPLTQQRRVSLRQCALHNSFYAKELIKSRCELVRLTECIKELEKEKVLYKDQTVKANRRAAAATAAATVQAARADGILQFGFKEETIKADIKKLQKERVRLNRQVVELENVIITIKRKIRQIKIQDGNNQIRK